MSRETFQEAKLNNTFEFQNFCFLNEDAGDEVELEKRWRVSKAFDGARPPNGTARHSARLSSFSIKPDIRATPFAWQDPATIPKRRWVYGRHYIRQFVGVTVAPGGMGKSSLSIVEALAMCTGRPLLGETVHEPCKVWIWNGEDPFEEMQRRIIAACRYHHITEADIVGRLFVDSGRDMPMVLVREASEGIEVAEPQVEAIVETIRANEIDMFIADPFVLTHQVNENSNTAVDQAMRQWAKIAEKTNTAGGLFHHVRKGIAGQGEFTVEDGRGASAMLAAARSARVLNRMTEEEGRKAEVENHRQYFRVDNGKANLAPPAQQTSWRKIVSHELPNGDSVGVIEEWKWPDPLADMTVADLYAVQKAIDGKGYRVNVQSNNWVGHAIAELLDLNADDQTHKDRIKSMVNIWLMSGALRVSESKDEKGKTRPILEVGQWANQ